MGAAPGVLAGLGLFFVGMRLVGSHLQQLASGRIRDLLARTLERPAVAPLAGFLSGALTQSTSASTFIATSLLGAGSLKPPAALSMLAAANVGTSVLVLLATVDLQAAVLYLMALTGLAFLNGWDQAERSRHAVLAVLGLALLLYGLGMLKSGVAGLRGDPWMREFIEFAGSDAPVGFVAGFILAVAVQSSSIVTVLALPLVAEGLLSFDQVLLMVYGASAGSGYAALMLSAGLEGPPRQLALCQALLRTAAAVLLSGVQLLELATGLPLVMAGLAALTPDVATQSGLAYLMFQCVVAVLAALAFRPLLALTAAWSQPAAAPSEARPAYLFPAAVSEPATALSLAQREYQRLVTVLPQYLDPVRPEEERDPQGLPEVRRITGDRAVMTELEDFLGAMVRANPEMNQIEQVFELRSRALGLKALQSALAEFTGLLQQVPASERPAFVAHLVEGLHLLLGLAAEAVEDQDPETAALFATLTSERGELMDRVRRELLGGAASIAGRETLLSATLLFERILWMLRRLAPASAVVPGEEDGQPA
ncbi:MAG: phosphate:Na+ symporter [Pseudomonadota bacterium]|jgi:phosphate:Na+ symporter